MDMLTLTGSVVATIWATLLACLVIEGVLMNSRPELQEYVPGVISIIGFGWVMTIVMIWT